MLAKLASHDHHDPAHKHPPARRRRARRGLGRLGPTGADGVPDVWRGFTGTPRIVDCPERDRDITVEASGVQHMNGRVEREIYVSEIDGALTPAMARQLGAALIAAADEAETMAGYDQIHGVMT